MTGDHLDYGVIVGGSEAGDIGVEHGDILIEFAEAILGVDDERMEAARKAIAEKMGASALVDSAAVAALFNGIDRIADATGAPLEQSKADATVNLRAETGINEFSARKEALNAAQKTSQPDDMRQSNFYISDTSILLLS